VNQDLKFYNLGCGWLSAVGYGLFGSKPRFLKDNLNFNYPPLIDYLHDLPSRFGRFDVYTKVSFATAALALKDAGLLRREGKKNIGIIVGSSSGGYDNDLAYFKSTLEAKGSFTSPNLFSYTLPNVALGEIAVFFNFIGPIFCVGNQPDNPGEEAVFPALSLLESKQCEQILVGWAEVARDIQDSGDNPKGAAFAVLSPTKTDGCKAEFTVGSKLRFSDLFKG